jgi:hypothetical protein
MLKKVLSILGGNGLSLHFSSGAWRIRGIGVGRKGDWIDLCSDCPIDGL